MVRFGMPELLIVLAVVVLLFGAGRIGRIAGELGSAIRAFRSGMEDDKEEAKKENPKGIS